jgi:hypothetical protein
MGCHREGMAHDFEWYGVIVVNQGQSQPRRSPGRLYCTVGVDFIINSNLSLILKKSSGSADPDAKPQLRPCRQPLGAHTNGSHHPDNCCRPFTKQGIQVLQCVPFFTLFC